MLIFTGALPDFVIVDPVRLLPRFWATAWSLNISGQALSENTRKLKLRHIDAFYCFCDERFGMDSFDAAVSARDALRTQELLEAFYGSLTSTAAYSTTDVQRWDVVRSFVQLLARRLAPSSDSWSRLSSLLYAMGRMRRPRSGRYRFIRALPSVTVGELLEAAHPDSPCNPFKGEGTRWRNWFIVNLLLLVGVRRGEALLLEVDSLKSGLDPDVGEVTYWVNVTTTYEYDPRRTRPSMKTEHSHRQVPVSVEFATLYEQYLAEHRVGSDSHVYLLTSQQGNPLSAESVTKLFVALSECLSKEARDRFFERSGGKEHISPHDLRHTCATARWGQFIALDPNRDLALQRMRAFFGWSPASTMPEHYARAAIQDDLLRSWNEIFTAKTTVLRSTET